MNKYRKYLFVVLLLTVFNPTNLSAQQVQARVKGLETNAEYMTLLAQERELNRQIDSLVEEIAQIRESFRTDTADRKNLTTRILGLEDSVFDLRNRAGQLTDQINAIEQAWIVQHLDSSPTENNAETDQQNNRQDLPRETSPMLVNNPYFSEHLSPEDHASLLKAQNAETECLSLVRSYEAGNRSLESIRTIYDTVSQADSAAAIQFQFDSLVAVNARIADSLTQRWSFVYDTKTYTYIYLLDKGNRPDLLFEFNRKLSEMDQQRASVQGVFASDEVATYYLQKRLVTDFELTVASILGFDRSHDSLQHVMQSLPTAVSIDLPIITLQERIFLDYADIEVHKPVRYNSNNPIPACEIYPQGTIYRILLGTYSSPQTPTLFKGVEPLFQLKAEDKIRYFAGGFSSDSAAHAAQEQLKRMGFCRPEVVVWNDGNYRNISDPSDNPVDTMLYRVELLGVEELPDAIKDTIRTTTAGRDIARSGDRFIVGPFQGKEEAEQLRNALTAIKPEKMEIKIVETEK